MNIDSQFYANVLVIQPKAVLRARLSKAISHLIIHNILNLFLLL